MNVKRYLGRHSLSFSLSFFMHYRAASTQRLGQQKSSKTTCPPSVGESRSAFRESKSARNLIDRAESRPRDSHFPDESATMRVLVGHGENEERHNEIWDSKVGEERYVGGGKGRGRTTQATRVLRARRCISASRRARADRLSCKIYDETIMYRRGITKSRYRSERVINTGARPRVATTRTCTLALIQHKSNGPGGLCNLYSVVGGCVAIGKKRRECR